MGTERTIIRESGRHEIDLRITQFNSGKKGVMLQLT